MNSKISEYSEAFRAAADDFIENAADWLLNLTMGERVIGVCLFTLFVMYLIVTHARRKRNPGTFGRQFLVACVLVTVVGFGLSQMAGNEGGTLSYMFGR